MMDRNQRVFERFVNGNAIILRTGESLMCMSVDALLRLCSGVLVC